MACTFSDRKMAKLKTIQQELHINLQTRSPEAEAFKGFIDLCEERERVYYQAWKGLLMYLEMSKIPKEIQEFIKKQSWDLRGYE